MTRARDATVSRGAPLPLQAPTAFVRIRPRGSTALRRGATRARCARCTARAARASRSSAPRAGVTLRGVFITFLSDFGLKDDFVGTCHGVIKRIAPDAQIIDITHGIPATSILQGALVLANTIGFMPVGVHLAIVDPGVGGPAAPARAPRRRKAGSTSGRTTGSCCRRRAVRGIDAAHELANPEYALDSISRTFHGRDLFAPAAAHLATGVPLAELGPPVDPEGLIRLDLPEPVVRRRRDLRRPCSTSTASATSP